LLPSQQALPEEVQAYRYAQGELLYRAKVVREEAVWRPVVVVLDVGAGVLGPVEQTVRWGAYLVGEATRRAGQPVVVVLVGAGGGAGSAGTSRGRRGGGAAAGGMGRVQVGEMERAADLVEWIWTRRWSAGGSGGGGGNGGAMRSLQVAEALRRSLGSRQAGAGGGSGSGGGGVRSPVVVVLSHPWFGEEEEPEAEVGQRSRTGAGNRQRGRGGPVPGLRGVFVQYPGYEVHPVLAERCEKWASIPAGPAGQEQLPTLLGDLLA
jgi:hypothetical protein